MKKGWVYKKIGEVCKTYAGGTPLKTCKEYYDGGTIPWLRSGEVCRKYIDSTELFITQKGMDNSSAKYYPVNTIVVAMYGATAAQVGILKIESTSNQAVCGILPNDRFVSEFLFYWFTHIKDFLASQAQGGAQPNISQVKIKNLTVPIPPLSEQKEIVEYLDSSFAKIDKVKANAAKNLEEAKALFQSALKDALEPKEGWEEKTLGDVGTFKRGGNFSKKDFIENGFPCIHYGQIHTKFGIETFKHLSSVPVEMVKPDRCAQKGDLVIAITSEDDAGSCKCTAWMGDYDAYVGGHAAIYRHSMEPKFVSFYFLSPYFQKAKLEYTHGFKVVEISPKDIAKIPISVPSFSEQQSIVSFLDSLNEKVNTLQQNYSHICDECDALKQAILRQVFE